MDKLRVKICCIASEAEAAMAAGAGADLIGLVGPMPTGPGPIPLEHAARIADSAPEAVRPVLLTASETAAEIAADARKARVDTVQIVRHIAPAEAEALGATGLGYIQVVHVEGAEALSLIPTYAPHAEAFLLDSGRPSQAMLGGTGDTHDWEISAEFVRRSPLPVFLAGGLDPQNVAEAVARVRPAGVDVCSRLRPDGALDLGLLAAFIAAARGGTA